MADITVTEHLLLHQKRSPQATGQFTGLLYDLILSGKTISRRINKAGLLDILGGTGEVNVQGENVQKMDSIANRILLYRMERCGALCAMGSEEERGAGISPRRLYPDLRPPRWFVQYRRQHQCGHHLLHPAPSCGQHR